VPHLKIYEKTMEAQICETYKGLPMWEIHFKDVTSSGVGYASGILIKPKLNECVRCSVTTLNNASRGVMEVGWHKLGNLPSGGKEKCEE
jgi:hypothetical protein